MGVSHEEPGKARLAGLLTFQMKGLTMLKLGVLHRSRLWGKNQWRVGWDGGYFAYFTQQDDAKRAIEKIRWRVRTGQCPTYKDYR